MTKEDGMDIVRKVEERTADAPSSLSETQDRELRVRVRAETLAKMKKRAVATLEAPVGSSWELLCDEGAYLAGEDDAPPPLVYFASAVAF
jgi:hypothetical protein